MTKKYMVVGMIESGAGFNMSPIIYYVDSKDEIKKYEYEFFICTINVINLEQSRKYAEGWVQAKNPAYIDFD